MAKTKRMLAIILLSMAAIFLVGGILFSGIFASAEGEVTYSTETVSNVSDYSWGESMTVADGISTDNTILAGGAVSEVGGTFSLVFKMNFTDMSTWGEEQYIHFNFDEGNNRTNIFRIGYGSGGVASYHLVCGVSNPATYGVTSETIPSVGWHTVKLTVQERYVDGAAQGIRMSIALDGTVVADHDFADGVLLGAATVSILNQSKQNVQFSAADVTYSEETNTDVAEYAWGNTMTAEAGIPGGGTNTIIAGGAVSGAFSLVFKMDFSDITAWGNEQYVHFNFDQGNGNTNIFRIGYSGTQVSYHLVFGSEVQGFTSDDIPAAGTHTVKLMAQQRYVGGFAQGIRLSIAIDGSVVAAHDFANGSLLYPGTFSILNQSPAAVTFHSNGTVTYSEATDTDIITLNFNGGEDFREPVANGWHTASWAMPASAYSLVFDCAFDTSAAWNNPVQFILNDGTNQQHFRMQYKTDGDAPYMEYTLISSAGTYTAAGDPLTGTHTVKIMTQTRAFNGADQGIRMSITIDGAEVFGMDMPSAVRTGTATLDIVNNQTGLENMGISSAYDEFGEGTRPQAQDISAFNFSNGAQILPGHPYTLAGDGSYIVVAQQKLGDKAFSFKFDLDFGTFADWTADEILQIGVDSGYRFNLSRNAEGKTVVAFMAPGAAEVKYTADDVFNGVHEVEVAAYDYMADDTRMGLYLTLSIDGERIAETWLKSADYTTASNWSFTNRTGVDLIFASTSTLTQGERPEATDISAYTFGETEISPADPYTIAGNGSYIVNGNQLIGDKAFAFKFKLDFGTFANWAADQAFQTGLDEGYRFNIGKNAEGDAYVFFMAPGSAGQQITVGDGWNGVHEVEVAAYDALIDGEFGGICMELLIDGEVVAETVLNGANYSDPSVWSFTNTTGVDLTVMSTEDNSSITYSEKQFTDVTTYFSSRVDAVDGFLLGYEGNTDGNPSLIVDGTNKLGNAAFSLALRVNFDTFENWQAGQWFSFLVDAGFYFRLGKAESGDLQVQVFAHSDVNGGLHGSETVSLSPLTGWHEINFTAQDALEGGALCGVRMAVEIDDQEVISHLFARASYMQDLTNKNFCLINQTGANITFGSTINITSLTEETFTDYTEYGFSGDLLQDGVLKYSASAYGITSRDSRAGAEPMDLMFVLDFGTSAWRAEGGYLHVKMQGFEFRIENNTATGNHRLGMRYNNNSDGFQYKDLGVCLTGQQAVKMTLRGAYSGETFVGIRMEMSVGDYDFAIFLNGRNFDPVPTAADAFLITNVSGVDLGFTSDVEGIRSYAVGVLNGYEDADYSGSYLTQMQSVRDAAIAEISGSTLTTAYAIRERLNTAVAALDAIWTIEREEQFAAAKEDAASQLEDFLTENGGNYYEEQLTQLEELVTEGAAEIRGLTAEYENDISVILTQWLDRLNAVPDKAAVDALKALRAQYKGELDAYYNGLNETDYSAENYAAIGAVYNEAKQQLAAASTEEEMRNIRDVALAEMDEVLTVAEEQAAAALKTAKNNAISELQAYATQSDYAEATWQRVQSEVEKGVAAINAAADENAVNAALGAAKAAIDAIAKDAPASSGGGCSGEVAGISAAAAAILLAASAGIALLRGKREH